MADSRLSFDILAHDHASGTFAKVATNSRLLNAALDDVNTNGRGLARLSLAPALVPTLAVASSSAVSLATALGSAAGAGGIFGASVVGQITEMAKQQKAIAQVQTKLSGMDKTSKEYGATVVDLHNKQSAFNKQFGPAATGLDKMKLAWHDFLNKTSGTTNNVIAKTMHLLVTVLPKLVPVSNAAGRAIGRLVGDLNKWAKSPAFDRLTHFFATSGARNITRFGHVIGNVFVGVGGILKNFVGPGDRAAASLEKLTRKFAAWGNSKGVSASVQKFLTYAHDNGPKVTAILSSLVKILPKLVASFASIGGLSLAGASGFMSLLANLPTPVFKALATSIFAIAAATKAVRAGMAAWAAIQWVLDAALNANPIGLIIIAIAALVGGLVLAYKHSETFRNIVQGVFRSVAGAGKFMWDGVLKPTFKFLINAWMTVAGAIINGAAHAFGWVPGIGPKLRAAASWFNDFRAKVNRQIDGIKDPKINVSAPGADHVLSQLATIKKFIHDIKSAGPVRAPSPKNLGGLLAPHYASGTSFFSGGFTHLDERGPETVSWLPRGARIDTAQASARAMRAAPPAGGGITVIVNGALDPKAVAKQIEQMLDKYRHDKGGQLAFQR